MLDFNQAEEQKDFAGAIPPESCVVLSMELRAPKAGKEGSHPLLSKSAKGNEYIDVEFKVAQGSFKGRTIWQNFTVEGSEKAKSISMSTLRAIIESSRGIDPKDASPAAIQSRHVSDWSDFQGVSFIAKVGAVCEQEYNGPNWYVNNTIKKIITPNMEEYNLVGEKGELITDNPLPEKPGTAAGSAPTGGSSWGAQSEPAKEAAAPEQQSPVTASQSATPAWAQK